MACVSRAHTCCWPAVVQGLVPTWLHGKGECYFAGGWARSWQLPTRGHGAGLCLLVGRAGPSTNKLEGGNQNGAYQHQCPWDRMNSPQWLLPVPWGSPSCFLPPWEVFQEQQLGLTCFSNSCLLAGFQSVRYCVHP